jgi:hypothetical protein
MSCWNRWYILDNGAYYATASTSMTDYKQKRKHVPSRLLAGFGAVTPKHKPEDWRKVQAEMEEAMAEGDIVAEFSEVNSEAAISTLIKQKFHTWGGGVPVRFSSTAWWA